MYRAFNLTECVWANVPTTSQGDLIQLVQKLKVRKSLASFVKSGTVDGSQLINNWFPKVQADVFISHSRKDALSAIKFADWLRTKFGLTSFVDSCVWGYADTLLRSIDKVYCWQPDTQMYDYTKRNASTSHVHMMLAHALAEMLDTAECVFFLNTPHSITSTKLLRKTQSPWLFFELSTMRTIRRKKPERLLREEIQLEEHLRKAAALPIEYIAPLEELTPLTGDQLAVWRQRHASKLRRHRHPLDLLYSIAPE